MIPPAAPEPPAEQEQSEIPEDNAAPEQPGAIDHLTWQIATKRLRALGVGKSKQHFTYLEDKNLFLFTCNASHLDDAARTRTFQAEAEEPLLAVRQVLEKLQTWQDSEITPRSPSRTSPRGGL